MKILYVGTERDDARAVGTALSVFGGNAKVQWTPSLNQVVKWIDLTQNPRALILEAQPNSNTWQSVLKYVAQVSAPLAIVVIVPEGPHPQPVEPDAYECIVRNASFLRELPAVPQGDGFENELVKFEHAMRADLERRLLQATTGIEEAERHHQSAIEAANQRLAATQAQHEIAMARAIAMRDMANEQFREAALEVDRIRRSHTSAVSNAERLARREAELMRQLADADAARSEDRWVAADVARLTERQAALEGQLQAECATRDALEQAVADTQAALRSEQNRHAAAVAKAAIELADRVALFDLELAQADAERARLATKLREVEEAGDLSRREYQSAVLDVARLTEREASLEAELEEGRATRSALEQTAADAQAALRSEQQRFDLEHAQAESERTSLATKLREVDEARDLARREHQSAVLDVARLTEREASLEANLEEERATRNALEQAIADSQAALRDAEQRHSQTLATAARDHAARLARFGDERTQAAAKYASLAAQLQEIEQARDVARNEHQSALADLARLTEHAAAEQQAAAAVQADLEARLSGANDTIEGLQYTLAETRSTAADTERLLNEEATALRASSLMDAAGFNDRLDEQRQVLEGRLADAQDSHDTLTRECAVLQEALHTIQDESSRLAQEHRGELECMTREHAAVLATAARDHAARLARFDDERTQAAAKYASLAAQLQEIEQARDVARNEHQSALADLARLTEHTAAEQQAAAAVQADLEARLSGANDTIEGLQFTLAETRSTAADTERLLNEEATALRASSLMDAAGFKDRFEEQRQELEGRLAGELERLTREHAAVLATRDKDAEQLRADNRQLFQKAPLAMFRCLRDGAVMDANGMLTTLVGRSTEELRGANFAAAVFESPHDLSSLIERCVDSTGSEATETTWRHKDGSRLLVRLFACAISSDLIDFGVEDLTPVRALQDRLEQAHRMEAVGRLAAEVGVTCGNLLRGIHRDARQWLLSDGEPMASPQRADMLLEEITRAAGLLQHLAAYGEEESQRPAVVELGTVVRDMAPVLKRVAGDAVDVQLPGASGPLNVDAGAERIQRLLVTLASYTRDRMPFGGRLKIQLGTVVVDRHFIAKHPNVRVGPHALITVTESRRAARARGLLQLDDPENRPGSPGRTAVQASLDLGTLQELVGQCGGHLWMTAHPLGDMVVKIRLPLQMTYGQPAQHTLASGVGVRTSGKWFHR